MQISKIRKHQPMMMRNWRGDALRTIPWHHFRLTHSEVIEEFLVVDNCPGKYLDQLLQSFLRMATVSQSITSSGGHRHKETGMPIKITGCTYMGWGRFSCCVHLINKLLTSVELLCSGNLTYCTTHTQTGEGGVSEYTVPPTETTWLSYH